MDPTAIAAAPPAPPPAHAPAAPAPEPTAREAADAAARAFVGPLAPMRSTRRGDLRDPEVRHHVARSIARAYAQAIRRANDLRSEQRMLRLTSLLREQTQKAREELNLLEVLSASLEYIEPIYRNHLDREAAIDDPACPAGVAKAAFCRTVIGRLFRETETVGSKILRRTARAARAKDPDMRPRGGGRASSGKIWVIPANNPRLRPAQAPTFAEIETELKQLADDQGFAEVYVDWMTRTLVAVTGAIELKGRPDEAEGDTAAAAKLGQLEIRLDWGKWRSSGRTGLWAAFAPDHAEAEAHGLSNSLKLLQDSIRVTARTPSAATTYIHPHVNNGLLCFGEGALPSRMALRQGRLSDLMFVINEILHTYNPGSAYAQVGVWTNRRCPSCEVRSQAETHACPACARIVCEGCNHLCPTQAPGPGGQTLRAQYDPNCRSTRVCRSCTAVCPTCRARIPTTCRVIQRSNHPRMPNIDGCHGCVLRCACGRCDNRSYPGGGRCRVCVAEESQRLAPEPGQPLAPATTLAPDPQAAPLLLVLPGPVYAGEPLAREALMYIATSANVPAATHEDLDDAEDEDEDDEEESPRPVVAGRPDQDPVPQVYLPPLPDPVYRVVLFRPAFAGVPGPSGHTYVPDTDDEDLGAEVIFDAPAPASV